MPSRDPQRTEIGANRRREPLKGINHRDQLALGGGTRRLRRFFRKLLRDSIASLGCTTLGNVYLRSTWVRGSIQILMVCRELFQAGSELQIFWPSSIDPPSRDIDVEGLTTSWWIVPLKSLGSSLLGRATKTAGLLLAGD